MSTVLLLKWGVAIFLAGGDIFAENARAKATRLKWNVAVLGHEN